MNFIQLHNNFNNVVNNFNNIVIEVISQHKEKLLELNKKQLLEGKTNKDKDIRPLYTEDNYFSSIEKAQNYASWKEKITPNPKRNKNAPNLIIVGKFHKSIDIIKKQNYLEIDSNIDLGKRIQSKFKNILGINEDSKMLIKPELLITFKNRLTNELTK